MEPPTGFVCPVQRIAVRCRRQDGTFASGVLICSLSVEQGLIVLGRPCSQAADPVAVLLAYVNFYDLRGGGLETSLKGDKGGLGLTKRNKKRFDAQPMLVLLGSLAHNIVVWARRWLAVPQGRHCGILRMGRDVLHISGLLCFDALGAVKEIVLNQGARLAHVLLSSLQALLSPFHLVVRLGET
jgi:hypothetical protein